MEIAQQQMGFRRLQPVDQAVPDRLIGAAFAVACRLTVAFPGQVPIEQQPRFHLHRRAVEIGNAMDVIRRHRNFARARRSVQGGEAAGAFQITLGNRLAVRVQHAVLAEIVHQQEAAHIIDGQNLRRGKTVFPEIAVDGDKGVGVFGDMRHFRIGFSIQHRRTFRQRRPVHQDQAFAVFQRQVFIGSDRGVPGEVAARRLGMAVGGKKCSHRQHPFDAGMLRLGCLDHRQTAVAVLGQRQANPAKRQFVAGHFRPFHQADAEAKRLLETEFVDLRGMAHAIEIEVRDWTSVKVALGTSRTGSSAMARRKARASVDFPAPRSPVKARQSPGFKASARSSPSRMVAASSARRIHSASVIRRPRPATARRRECGR